MVEKVDNDYYTFVKENDWRKNMNFNEQLITLRKQNGLSQEQLGEQIGVSRQTISKWELGETTPEMGKLIQLSSYFDVSIDELAGKVSGQNTNTGYQPYRWHYEYKSKRRIFGLPLVHINIGHGIYKAKGIFAIGTISRGVFSLGMLSSGIISLGAISGGLISMGGGSLGLLFSLGGLSVGSISIGGLALGIFAFGGCAVGIYSIGGLAIAGKIAAGGYAYAPIAISDGTSGQIVFDIYQAHTSAEVRKAILDMYPKTWDIIVKLFSSVFLSR